MANKTFQVDFKFDALDRASGTFRAMGRALDTSLGGVQTRFKVFNRSLSDLQQKMSGVADKMALIGVGVAGAVTGASKNLADFEKTFGQILTKEGVLEMDSAPAERMRETLQALAKDMKVSTREAAALVNEIMQSGSTFEEAAKNAKTYRDTARTSEGSGGAVSPVEAADFFTDLSKNLQAGGFEKLAADQQKIADMFAFTAGKYSLTMQNLMEGSKASSIGLAQGMSLDYLLAISASLAEVGKKGSRADQAMASLFNRLSAPPAEARKALDRLNIDVLDNLQGAAGNFKQKTVGDALDDFGANGSVIAEATRILNDQSKRERARLDAVMALVDKRVGLSKGDKTELEKQLVQLLAANAGGIDIDAVLKQLSEKQKSGEISAGDVKALAGEEYADVATALLQQYQEIEKNQKRILEESKGFVEKSSSLQNQGIGRVFSDLAASFSTLSDTFAKTMQPVFVAVGDGLVAIMDRLTAFMKGFPGFTRFVTTGAVVLGGLAGGAMALVGTLAVLSKGVMAMAGAFRLGGAAISGFGSVLGALSRRLKARKVGRLMNDLVDSLDGGAGGRRRRRGFGNMLKGIGRGFANLLPMLGRMGPYGLAAAAAIGALYLAWKPLNKLSGGKFNEGLTQLQRSFSSLLQGDFSGAFDQFLDGMGKFRDGVVNILPDLGPVFEKFDKLAIAAGKFLDAILPGDGLKEGWDFIANTLGLVFDNILAVVEANISILTTSFEGLAKVIEGAFTLDAGKIAEGFGTAFNGVKDAMSELMTTIVGNWGEFLGSIGLDLESVSEMGSAIKEKAASMVDSVVSGIADWGQGIAVAVTGLVDYVVAGLAAWGSSIAEALKSYLPSFLVPNAPKIPSAANDNITVPKVNLPTMPRPEIDVGGPGQVIRDQAGAGRLETIVPLENESTRRAIDSGNDRLLSALSGVEGAVRGVDSTLRQKEFTAKVVGGGGYAASSPAPGSPRAANWSSSGMADPNL